jgi:arginine decarboxylase
LGKGNWQNTGGEKSKFGLTAGQILEVVTELAQACRLDSLKVLHVHLGSQIANLTDIKAGMQECAQFYAALRAAHAPIELVDVGGGLGIDYEGTRSRGYCSRNYAIEDYAQAVIVAFQQICETAQLPHPDIITESGRAMTAHHAVLMTQVIDWDMAPVTPPATANSYAMVTWFEQAVKQLNETDAPEYYRDADLKLTQAHQDFAQGRIGLNERAAVEARYYALVQQLPHFLNPQIRAHRVILEQLHEKMAIKYFCNFSIFQSLPDVWAIKQIFPIMPLTGLLQAPTQRVVLQDLTCDSDGRIDTYVDGHGIEHSLPLPALVQGEKNYLAFFLVGAYQEILGDMHNLFGDTDSVHVALDAKGSYTLEDASLGDKVETVLRHVNYEPQKLIRTYKQQLKNSDLTPRLKREYLDILVSGLSGYTYFEEEV